MVHCVDPIGDAMWQSWSRI